MISCRPSLKIKSNLGYKPIALFHRTHSFKAALIKENHDANVYNLLNLYALYHLADQSFSRLKLSISFCLKTCIVYILLQFLYHICTNLHKKERALSFSKEDHY